MSRNNPTDQERAREQLAPVLADAARQASIRPTSESLMDILNILQEAYQFPAGYRFSMYAYGPQARIPHGALHPETPTKGTQPKHRHGFADHVTRFAQDMAGTNPRTINLYSKLIFANRHMKVASSGDAIAIIEELSPQIPQPYTQAAWAFLHRRGLVTSTDPTGWQDQPEQHQDPRPQQGTQDDASTQQPQQDTQDDASTQQHAPPGAPADHRGQPCAACGAVHPPHLTVTVPETRQALGLEHIPRLIRQVLDLPSPEEAQQGLVPHDPLGRPASHHFNIQVTPAPGQEQHPWAQDHRVFRQTLDEIGLRGLSAFGTDSPDPTHDTHIDGREARIRVIVLLDRNNRIQARMQAAANDSDQRHTPVAHAVLDWLDHSTPQGRELHQQLTGALRLAQAGGTLTIHSARPASSGGPAEPQHDLQLHLQRKTAAAVNDQAAVRLLALMAHRVILETSDPDLQHTTTALAKLTAAHLAEVGANGVYITSRGQMLARALNPDDPEPPGTPNQPEEPQT